MKSSTETLIKAMRVLAVEIQSPDGVANAAIAEAADRLEELKAKREPLSETVLAELISDYGCRTNDWKDHIEFARAIEAAHGIGGE